MKDFLKIIGQISIVLVLCSSLVFIVAYINHSNQEEAKECFEECYVMIMDKCEDYSEDHCNRMDRISRNYCLNECNLDLTKEETKKIIIEEDI